MKKLAQMVKGGGSKHSSLSTKGVTIGEKHPQDEVLDISPIKKGRPLANSKGKWTMLPPKTKEGTKSRATSSKAVGRITTGLNH